MVGTRRFVGQAAGAHGHAPIVSKCIIDCELTRPQTALGLFLVILTYYFLHFLKFMISHAVVLLVFPRC